MGWQPGAGDEADASLPAGWAPGADRLARDPRLAAFAPVDGKYLPAPSGALALLADQVSGPRRDCPGATDGELAGLAKAWAAVESWAAGAKLAVIAEMIRRDQASAGAGRGGGLPDAWSASLRHELAAALSCSAQSAETVAWLACEQQARLPGIAALLAGGTLTYGKARAVIETFRYLSGADAAAAEAMIAEQLAGKTYPQVLRLAEQAALTVDPELATRRRERAQKQDARVSVFREQQGTAGLAGRDLPPDAALAAMASVNVRAQQYEDSGAFGDARRDALRACAYLDLLNGVPADARIAAAEPGDEAADAADELAWAQSRAAKTAGATAGEDNGATPGDEPGPEDEPEPGAAAGTGPAGDGASGTASGEAQPGTSGHRHGDSDSGCLPGCGCKDSAGRSPVGHGDPDRPADGDTAELDPRKNGDNDEPGDGSDPGDPGDPDGPPDGGSNPGGPDSGGPRPGGRSPGPGASQAGRALQARPPDLAVPLVTLLGLADRPGEIQGLGMLDPALARQLAAAAATSPHTKICLTVTSPEGYAIGHGCTRSSRVPRPATVPGHPPGATGGFPARLNLTIPATALPGPASHARHPGLWALTRSGSPDPPGQDRPPGQERPPDGTSPPGSAGAPGPADPGGGGYGTWTLTTPGGRRLTVRLDPVPTHDCDHRHETGAYQPGDKLRHLVQVRDGTCTFPTCNRHARESDFEHAQPYDKDGRTCACNAGARSRACHRVKQSTGWNLTQPKPGWHQWQTPAGHTYIQEPWRYPA